MEDTIWFGGSSNVTVDVQRGLTKSVLAVVWRFSCWLACQSTPATSSNLVSGGCSKGLCKEGAIGNTFPLNRILINKQGTYIMAVFGTGILSHDHVPAM